MKPAVFKIIANGSDITRLIKDRLVRLTLRDEAGVKSDAVTIELDNRDLAIELPSTGAKLEVWIGIGKELEFKGTYQVTELEEPLDEELLTISATAAEFKTSSIKSPKDRTFDAITYGDLVRQIAQEHGLSPVVSESLAKIEFAHIDQVAESDLNLLNRLGRQYDAIAKPVADRLLVTPKAEGKSASGQLMSETVIDDPANSSGRVTITERTNYQTIIAHWFDEEAQQKRSVKVGNGDEPVFTMRRQYQSEQEARDAAKAEFDKQARGKKTLSLSRPLMPELTAELRVLMKNHKPSANGLWIVETVEHVIEPDSVSSTTATLVTPK
ncbi:contractile injection system protein, VgrG/Pvc8 family [Vibrio cholerae]